MVRHERRCLILGSRQALERVGFALEQAIETLGLERVRLPDPVEVVAQMRDVDVVLAEVSRPTPAISFELGVATALGIPVVFCATVGAQVSPVFRPVVTYDESSPALRTMYVIAREIEKAVSGDMGPAREVLGPDAYGLYERFDGIVVHVDGVGGYVLIGSPGRRAAMLHVENMTPANAAAFRGGEVAVGDRVYAEVISVDTSRDQVQLRDLSAFRSGPTTPRSRSDKATMLIRVWSQLAPLARIDDQQLAKMTDAEREDVQRWLNRYRLELDSVRRVRNGAAHGEPIDADVLTTALERAEELVRTARHLPETARRAG